MWHSTTKQIPKPWHHGPVVRIIYSSYIDIQWFSTKLLSRNYFCYGPMKIKKLLSYWGMGYGWLICRPSYISSCIQHSCNLFPSFVSVDCVGELWRRGGVLPWSSTCLPQIRLVQFEESVVRLHGLQNRHWRSTRPQLRSHRPLGFRTDVHVQLSCYLVKGCYAIILEMDYFCIERFFDDFQWNIFAR